MIGTAIGGPGTGLAISKGLDTASSIMNSVGSGDWKIALGGVSNMIRKSDIVGNWTLDTEKLKQARESWPAWKP
jgi:hypothetical protein